MFDYIQRQASFIITLRDTFVGEYTISKTPMKSLVDTMKISDLIQLIKGKLVILTDYVRITDYMSKLISKSMFDIIKFIDSITSLRGRLVILRDAFFIDYDMSRAPVKELLDKAVLRDLVAKVGYTLTEIPVRRVYYLPIEYKELADIILPEDHNKTVDASKNLLNIFKSTRDKLGVVDPNIDKMISDLESVVNAMRYVKEKDEVTIDDVNQYIDYCNIAVDLAEDLYDIYVSKTGREIPDVEVWLTMARMNVGWMSKAAHLTPVKPVYHNLPIDCMKCLELSLKKIQESI
jgi:hypothetical protein